jgi:GNAT superfamily N-acetyltransferase
MSYQSEVLDERHRLTTFECGKPELDLWLRESARHAQAMRTCTTTVWQSGDGVVVAYYGLSAPVIEKQRLSRSIARGNPERIPATLIGRLALDRSLQGNGLGGALLADALEKILLASRAIAVRFVVVDAIDEDAAKFYQKHGFKETPVLNRLVRKMSDVEADLAR